MIFEKSGEKPIILAVDDSVENLQVLTSLLKDDYKVKVAKEGRKALEIAEMAPMPDLILLDVIMPGMNGFEVCEQLKSNPKTQKIPVIFLTALNEVADETNGLRIGGADFITKPINPEIVKARIGIHLALQQERRKSESLLKILLPDNVVSDLMVKGHHKPEVYRDVSILFCDFVGFTRISRSVTPEFLIEELTEIYGKFDEICHQNGTIRIKTIGDAYMAASGIHASKDDHAKNLVETGMRFIEYLEERNKTASQVWHCRIGINSGEVIAGIIGKSRFIYDIMGNDVNIAARVESKGTQMKVTISKATRDLLDEQYQFETQGLTELKGAGAIELFIVSRN